MANDSIPHWPRLTHGCCLPLYVQGSTNVSIEFTWTSHSEVSGKTWGRKQETGGIEKLHLWEADVAAMGGLRES